MVKITIKKSVWTPKTYPYLHDETPTQVFYGGAGWGKSVFVVRRAVLDVMTKQRNYLVVRNVRSTIQGSIFNEFLRAIDFFQVRPFFSVNLTELVITCKLNDRQIFFRGMDDPEKLKSIVPRIGVITDVIMEEASELEYRDFLQLGIRQRGIDYDIVKRRHIVFNPVDRRHWLKQKLLTDVPDYVPEYRSPSGRMLVVWGTYLDNPFLTEQDRQSLEALRDEDPYYYEVYALGHWGVLGNLIFTKVRVEDLAAVYGSWDRFKNGLDFGFSAGPSALVRCGLDREKRTLYVFRELYEKALETPQLAAAVRGLCGEEVVRADCEDPRTISEMRHDADNPCNVRPVKKGKDSVVHGLHWLRRHTIVIDKSCQGAINEVQVAHWATDKAGEPINEPAKGMQDHAIDAMRYAFEDEMGAKAKPVIVGWGGDEVEDIDIEEAA